MYKIYIAFFMLLFASVAYTQVKLPSLFCDNMVMQQKMEVSVWGTDKPNTTITIAGSWNETSTAKAGKDGKWKTKLKTPEAGGPYTLSIEGSNRVILENVLIGEVWICSGQSNMEMPVKGYVDQPVNGSNEAILNSTNNKIRIFTVERNPSLLPLDEVNGKWLRANPMTVKDFSAVGYFFGRKLNSLLNIPIGLIHTSWGASKIESWMDEQSFSELMEIEPVKKITTDKPQKEPALLYNGMLHPLQKYAIKGAIWYQGESNRSDAEKYSKLFPAMIEQWRNQWQQGDLPFYFVQIAPFGYGNGNAGFVREAQLKTMQTVKNTGMVVTLDAGNCEFIHPPEKRLVGERLAYWALAKDYKFEGIAYTGPVYKRMEKTNDGKINLYFNYSPIGLSSFGKPLSGFEVAGEDRVFYPAKVLITMGNKQVTVFSDSVKNPVAVRYAFKNCPEGTLFNVEGLPASSFRTDKW